MPGTASDQLIRSPDNEVVRYLRRLADRRPPGQVLLEGPRVIAEAVACGVELELLAVREGDDTGDGAGTPARKRVVLSRELFKRVSQTVTPQGVLAVGRRELAPAGAALAAAAAAGWPLVVLDGVQDPGNVGAICRTAAAAGAPAVAVLPGTADPLGPKAIRASAGQVFRPVVARAGWDDLRGRHGYGAAAHGGAPLATTPVESAGLLVLGSEAHGLSQADLEPVTIDLAEGVESLNVAAAAALLLFEIRRRKAA